MALVKVIIEGAFNLYLALFAWAGVWGELAGLALLTAMIAVLIFRHTSNQRAIRRIKDLLISHLLEVALYRDDLGVVWRAQAALVRDNLRYLGHALVPLACMIVPVGVIFAQGEMRYHHRPLKVGERAILAVTVRPGADLSRPRITAARGIAVETPPLRLPAAHEVDWRIRGAEAGRHRVRISAAGGEAVAFIAVGDLLALGGARAPVSLRSAGGQWWQWLLTPSEDVGIPQGSSITGIRVSYPAVELRILRWRASWVWPWLLLSLAFGYALKGPLRVEI